jgi:hypothetical protein
MRLAELSLLLIPLGVVVAWFCGVRGLSLRGVVAVIALFTLIACTLYLVGNARVFRGAYVPAHLEGTHIVPGRSS